MINDITKSSKGDIRREQKKSYFMQEISQAIQQISQDEKTLQKIFISRIDLSADTGICYLFFGTCDSNDETSQEIYEKARQTLILYAPSIRSALAKMTHSRYVPKLKFLFDDKLENVRKIDNLINQVQEEFAGTENK